MNEFDIGPVDCAAPTERHRAQRFPLFANDSVPDDRCEMQSPEFCHLDGAKLALDRFVVSANCGII